MDHADRPGCGYEAEDRVARACKRRGYDVEQLDRNETYDMVINGHDIDVKSACQTEYEGSDGYPIKGYVFHNLSDGADFHICACMDNDRDRIERMYVIPGEEFDQVTFTLTDTAKDKYDEYMNNFEQLEKKAEMRRIGDRETAEQKIRKRRIRQARKGMGTPSERQGRTGASDFTRAVKDAYIKGILSSLVLKVLQKRYGVPDEEVTDVLDKLNLMGAITHGKSLSDDV